MDLGGADDDDDDVGDGNDGPAVVCAGVSVGDDTEDAVGDDGGGGTVTVTYDVCQMV